MQPATRPKLTRKNAIDLFLLGEHLSWSKKLENVILSGEIFWP
jgi:hypothetical protein